MWLLRFTCGAAVGHFEQITYAAAPVTAETTFTKRQTQKTTLKLGSLRPTTEYVVHVQASTTTLLVSPTSVAAHVTTVEADVPSAPSIRELKMISPFNATLFWNRPSDTGGGAIDSSTVYM